MNNLCNEMSINKSEKQNEDLKKAFSKCHSRLTLTNETSEKRFVNQVIKRIQANPENIDPKKVANYVLEKTKDNDKIDVQKVLDELRKRIDETRKDVETKVFIAIWRLINLGRIFI